MKPVALVAPFFQDNTLRYVRAFADLPGVRLGIISHDPLHKLPVDLRARLHGYARTDNCMDGEHLAAACATLSERMGPLAGLHGMLEQLQVPLGYARTKLGIPGMGFDTARNFRDKARMKDVLRAAGVPVAKHRLVQQDADAFELIDEVGYPIIVKPVDGLGSRGTWRIRNEAELREALQALQPSPQRPLQAEEFVTGSEHTCETVTIDGKPVWHSGTRYLPGPLEVLENPWIQYCVLLPREEDADFQAFKAINTAALTALGMDTGLSHMEWFRRKDGTHVVSEVGARPPGVHIMPMMSQVHQVDMIRAWARLMVHGEFTPPRRQCAAGAAFFRGQGKGNAVKAVHGLDRAQKEIGHLVVDRSLPKVGQPAAESYEGEGWALLRHDDTEVVRQGLLRLVSLVRVELG